MRAISGLLTRIGIREMLEPLAEQSSCLVCREEFSTNPQSQSAEPSLKPIGDHVVILMCGHIFHVNCAKPWNITPKSCMLCKKGLYSIKWSDESSSAEKVYKVVKQSLLRGFQLAGFVALNFAIRVFDRKMTYMTIWRDDEKKITDLAHFCIYLLVNLLQRKVLPFGFVFSDSYCDRYVYNFSKSTAIRDYCLVGFTLTTGVLLCKLVQHLFNVCVQRSSQSSPYRIIRGYVYADGSKTK